MATIQGSAKTTASTITVWIDDTNVPLDSNGNFALDLGAGNYILNWFVSGDEGDTYEVGITSPPSAVCGSGNVTLDSDPKDIGFKKFTI